MTNTSNITQNIDNASTIRAIEAMLKCRLQIPRANALVCKPKSTNMADRHFKAVLFIHLQNWTSFLLFTTHFYSVGLNSGCCCGATINRISCTLRFGFCSLLPLSFTKFIRTNQSYLYVFCKLVKHS